MNTDHSNLNIVCITSALHPTYMYTMLSKNIYIYIFSYLLLLLLLLLLLFIIIFNIIIIYIHFVLSLFLN